jgi:V8-like Glu-specific endopeptidase
MLSPDLVRSVHNAVCAVGVLPVPLEDWLRRPREYPLEVQGSRFLVRPNTVLTNRHVLESTAARANLLDAPETQFFVSFIAPSQTSRHIGTLRMIRRTYVPQEGELDVALLEIKPEPKAHFEGILPLAVAKSPAVAVSEEVYVCGYPYGNILLEPEGRPYRFGPVIQQGYVSGLSPFAGSEAPEEILLDVRTAHGMSGSPVVRSTTGEVIGLHYEAVMEKASITTTSFAIPLDSQRIARWLAEFDAVLRDA